MDGYQEINQFVCNLYTADFFHSLGLAQSSESEDPEVDEDEEAEEVVEEAEEEEVDELEESVEFEDIPFFFFGFLDNPWKLCFLFRFLRAASFLALK